MSKSHLPHESDILLKIPIHMNAYYIKVTYPLLWEYLTKKSLSRDNTREKVNIAFNTNYLILFYSSLT